MNWYTKRQRAKKEKRVEQISLRIDHFCEAIAGIEEDLWPDEHQELLEKRTRLAWERSDLLLELGGFNELHTRNNS